MRDWVTFESEVRVENPKTEEEMLFRVEPKTFPSLAARDISSRVF